MSVAPGGDNPLADKDEAMMVQRAIQLYRERQDVTAKRKTRVSYDHLFERFQAAFGDRELESLQPEEI